VPSLTSSVYPQSAYGAFVIDFANSQGLTATIMGGAIKNAGVWRPVPQTSIMLQDNVTNHVYVSEDGRTVSSIDAVPANGFTLYDIAVARGTITSITDQRPSTTDLLPTPAGINVTTKTLTHDEITNLPTTAVDLVPAPGETGRIKFIGAVLKSHIVVGYESISQDDAVVGIGFGDSDYRAPYIYNITSPTNTQHVTQLLHYVGDWDAEMSAGSALPNNAVFPKLASLRINQPLRLLGWNGDETDSESIPFTAGDPDNTLSVTLFYLVMNI